MAKFKPYKFNPIKDFDLDIPRNKRQEALEAAAEFLKEALLENIGQAKSPVSNGKWIKGLSPEYKKRKSEESSELFANLELSGSLLDGLSVEVEKNQIIFDLPEEEYGKAEGHITGEYGKFSKKVKPRQFLPQGTEKFRRDILSDVKEILREFEDGED